MARDGVGAERRALVDLDPLELLAVALSVAAIWWTSVRRPICWPVGLAASILYGWIFYGARLYSDALLQVVFAVLICYGWWNWRRARHLPADAAAGAPRSVPAVVRAPLRELAASLLLGAAGALVLGWLAARYTNAVFPWLDASLSAASVVGQYWTARLYRASWLLWIAVDTVYVGLYVNRHLLLTAGLYAGFVCLAAYGWWRWRPAASADDPA